jgi:hypothetical protein
MTTSCTNSDAHYPFAGHFQVDTHGLTPVVLCLFLIDVFEGQDELPGLGGDFSFVLAPLPKIGICYIFYLPDEEFEASVTCLFSANALCFMPLDGLADVAKYTSRKIIQLVKE